MARGMGWDMVLDMVPDMVPDISITHREITELTAITVR